MIPFSFSVPSCREMRVLHEIKQAVRIFCDIIRGRKEITCPRE